MYLAWLLEVFFPSKGRCKKLKFIWVVLTVSHLLRSSAFFSQNMKIKIYVSFAWLVNNFVDILFKLCPLSQCQTLLLLLLWLLLWGTRPGLMCPESQSNSWWQSSVGVTQVCKMWIKLQNSITQKVSSLYSSSFHLFRDLGSQLGVKGHGVWDINFCSVSKTV